MSGSAVLLHLAGAVALLLWATRMVHTGVERAYGDVLRRHLRDTMHNPLTAVFVGAMLAIALQSSTAVTLLVSSFAGAGLVGGLAAQLAVRGAEVGSALVVRILTFDLSLLVPLCLMLGTVLFMATERRAQRQIGCILIGVGLLVLSLELIEQAAEPMRDSRLLPFVIGYLSGDMVTAFLLAGGVTWLFHSSIAAVLLLATLAGRGLVPADLGIAMVLGVNFGSSVIAPLLTRKSPPEVRAVPIGNLLMRGAGSIALLTAFLIFRPSLGFLGATVPERIVNAHILFNCVILLAGVPLAKPAYRLSQRLVALGSGAGGKSPLAAKPTALDPAALETPSLALANASRETVGICETVEIMLASIIELYEHPDRDRAAMLADMDDHLDRRHAAIKLYLARIGAHGMTEEEALRMQELLDACIKLEQVGDIVVRNMLVHVARLRDRGLEFTPEGWRELSSLHASVLANARLAFNVIVSRDPVTARQLVREKERMRDLERDTSRRHFERLRQGTARSLETSSLHLDTIRDLKQINSLLASIAYPVLEKEGVLRGSRLKKAG